jgi:hypothetical protein
MEGNLKMTAKQSQQLKEATALESMGQIPGYREVGLTPKFAKLVMERQSISDQIDELEEKKKGLSDLIFQDLAGTGLKAVQVDDYRPTVVDQDRRSISAERLLELGVPATTIEAATVVSHSSYLRVYDTAKGRTRGQEKRSGVESIRKGGKH